MERFNASAVDLKSTSERIRIEHSLISAHARTSNLCVYESGHSVFIAFDFIFDESCTPTDPRISCPEQIALEYRKPVDDSQPPEIWAIRENFPKDLPHLNPVSRDKPASICLWRDGGNKSLYEHRGVLGLLDILLEWLCDAQDGTLQHDGWEPTPRGSDVQIFCRVGDLQRLIHNLMNEQTQIQYAQSSTDLMFVDAEPIIGSISQKRQFSGQGRHKYKITNSKSGFNADSAIALLLAPLTSESNKHNPLEITAEEDLDNYLNYCDIDYSSYQLKQYARSLLPKKNKPNTVYLSVLIAHKRPIRLIQDVPDLAEGDAGKIEIIALLAIVDVKNNYSLTFRPCSLASEGSRPLLSKVSKTTDVDGKHVAVAGCGAIGSAIADMLCKQGIRRLTLVDKDRFSPHNPARHVLGKNSTNTPKVYGLSAYLQFNYHTENINPLWLDLDRHNVASPEIMQASLLIDCTANPGISNEIDLGTRGLPATKCYISKAGRMGIFLSRSPKQTFFDLDLISYLAATQYEKVSAWLSNEETLDRTNLGIGCGSNTFEMPYCTIQNHNAFFQTLINQKLRDTGFASVCINTLDENFLPSGHITMSVPEFTESIIGEGQQRWAVALSSEVQNIIETRTHADLPNEATGFLMGAFNTTLKRITIVSATYVPQKNPSSTSAELPPVCDDAEAMEIFNKTGGHIFPVGTWHSHPSYSAAPSPRDKITLAGLTQTLSENPQPYIMLINSQDNQKSLSLITPEEWY